MELRLRGTIAGGKLIVALPPESPEGEVDVVVSQTGSTNAEARNRELFAWLDRHHADPNRRTRTREEIDVSLQAERDSWD